jgi:hypothetical protein
LLGTLAAYWNKKSTSTFLPAPNQRKLKYFDGAQHRSGDNTSKQHFESLLKDSHYASDMHAHPFEGIHENQGYTEQHKVRDILLFCIGLTLTIVLLGTIYRKLTALPHHKSKGGYHSPGKKQSDPTANDSKYENTIEIIRLNQRGKFIDQRGGQETQGIYDKGCKPTTIDTLDSLHNSGHENMRSRVGFYPQATDGSPLSRTTRSSTRSTAGQIQRAGHFNGMVKFDSAYENLPIRSKLAGSTSASNSSSASTEGGFTIQMMKNSMSNDQTIDRVDTIEELTRSKSRGRTDSSNSLQPEFARDNRYADEPWLRDQSTTLPTTRGKGAKSVTVGAASRAGGERDSRDSSSASSQYDGFNPVRLQQHAQNSWFADMSK